MKKQNLKSRKMQAGLTLIELAVVGVFLAVLALFAVNTFSSKVTVGTKSQGLYSAADKIAQSWASVVANCGISADITQNAVGTGAAGNLSVLLGTDPTPESDFQACFAASGVKPLAGLSSGAAGAEKVYGFSVQVGYSTSEPGRVQVTFRDVPDELVVPMYNKYSSVSTASTATTLPATADTTDATVRFSAATAGKRDVTVIRTL